MSNPAYHHDILESSYKGHSIFMGQQLQQAVSILDKGGVIAYPTDTVYGLGADAFNEAAVNRIYRIKQRSSNQPLSLLIADMDGLAHLTDDLSEVAQILADQYWPGGLTLVLRKASSVPRWVTSGGETVAVRVPDHTVTQELIRVLGKPLIGTSANLSGSPSVISAEEVNVQLGSAVDFVLDGGICPGGVESTVIDVTGDTPVVLREGAISSEDIREFLSRK